MHEFSKVGIGNIFLVQDKFIHDFRMIGFICFIIGGDFMIWFTISVIIISKDRDGNQLRKSI